MIWIIELTYRVFRWGVIVSLFDLLAGVVAAQPPRNPEGERFCSFAVRVVDEQGKVLPFRIQSISPRSASDGRPNARRTSFDSGRVAFDGLKVMRIPCYEAATVSFVPTQPSRTESIYPFDWHIRLPLGARNSMLVLSANRILPLHDVRREARELRVRVPGGVQRFGKEAYLLCMAIAYGNSGSDNAGLRQHHLLADGEVAVFDVTEGPYVVVLHDGVKTVLVRHADVTLFGSGSLGRRELIMDPPR